MRAIVTGGAGFLGAHLARTLAERGDEVTAVDVIDSTPLLEGVDGVKLERGDVGWWPDVLDVVHRADPDVIFHTAGILSANAEARPLAAYRANSVGTFNVLEAARLTDGAKVVFTSTIATYGPGVAKTVDESTQQRPVTMYGVTKVFNELLGEYYARRFGVDFRGVRFPSVIGAGRGPGGASAYSSLLVSEPARGRRFVVPVTEETTMPLLYLNDAIAALLGLSEAKQGNLRRRTYGVEGFSPTAGELADAVRRRVPGADIVFEPDAHVVEIVRSWPERLDGSEAAADWGWKAGYELDDAVEDFVGELERHPEWP